jgi:protein-tyrosine phosphatase
VVTLPNGYRVVAVSFDPPDPYGRGQLPDFGLYLDGRWKPPWSHDHLDWPDFGVPTDLIQVTITLRSLLERAGQGQAVEIGCIGGHGRTGTALACLAILSGLPGEEAVAWIRDQYCSEAVETAEQADFVIAFAEHVRTRS